MLRWRMTCCKCEKGKRLHEAGQYGADHAQVVPTCRGANKPAEYESPASESPPEEPDFIDSTNVLSIRRFFPDTAFSGFA